MDQSGQGLDGVLEDGKAGGIGKGQGSVPCRQLRAKWKDDEGSDILC